MGGFGRIEEYLEYIGRHRGSRFGRRFRAQFRDTRGTAELAMLAAPTEEEYAQFCRVVATMTDQEKQHVEALSDEEIRAIAARSGADCGNTNIFLNGYVLQRYPRDESKVGGGQSSGNSGNSGHS